MKESALVKEQEIFEKIIQIEQRRIEFDEKPLTEQKEERIHRQKMEQKRMGLQEKSQMAIIYLVKSIAKEN